MQKAIRALRSNRLFAALLAGVMSFTMTFAGTIGNGVVVAADPQDGAPAAKWYQNFEQPGSASTYGIESPGSASAVTADTTKTAYADSKTSARLVTNTYNTSSNTAWNTGIYGFRAMPQEDVADSVVGSVYYDASAYDYFSLYVLDTSGANNPNVVFRDADGNTWSPDTGSLKSVKNVWTRLSIPLDKTKIDFSRIVSIAIGEYWGYGNTYYFDELYFAMNATDLPPAYPVPPQPPAAPMMFQSFDEPGQDGNYGIVGQGTATAAQRVQTPKPYWSSVGALKATHNAYTDGATTKNEAWNTGIYGVRIAPQSSATVTGATYTDASNYNYLMFYMYDTSAGAGINAHVVFKDASGATWDTDTGSTVKTVSNQWVKLTVALDRTKLDWSRLVEIQLGTYWGYGNVYYYDDLYLAQQPTDPSPADLPNPTKLFNDFETLTGISSGSGATVAASSEAANMAGIQGVSLTTTASGWPYVNNAYVRVTGKSGGEFDASGYRYLAFYIKDTQGSNGAEIRIKDASGGTYDVWGPSATKNKWVKIAIPLAEATELDLSHIATIDIGEYNTGTYYMDDVYFAMNENDTLAGFVSETQNIGGVWYQSFETKGSDGSYGITAGSGVQTSVSASASANPFHSFSVRATVAADSADPAVSGITVKPQALGASANVNAPYDYEAEIDATNYSYLNFYVRDQQGGQSLRVQLQDGVGNLVEEDSSALTAQGSWTRISVPLDKSANFLYSRLAEVRIVLAKAGVYDLDEFYLSKEPGEGFPNAGYTDLVLRDVDGEAMPFQNGVPLGSFEKQKDRVYVSLGGEWKKQRTALDANVSASARTTDRLQALEAEAAGREAVNFDDSGWADKTLPMPEDEAVAYESANGPEGKSDKSGYQGGVWYRKHFEVAGDLAGKPALLSFLGVNYYADVWINGHYAGGHAGGYTPFALDTGQWLNYGGDNVIAVRVDNPLWDTFANGEMIPYKKSDWFNYTGILRDAYLEVQTDAHVVRSDVRTLDTDGNLSVRTFLNNTGASARDLTLTYTVYEANVNDANAASEFAEDLKGVATLTTDSRSVQVAEHSQAVDKLQLRVPNPKLWTPETPNLYVLKAELRDGDTVTDTFYTQFGIRTLEADGVQIKLNGELAPFLAGVGYTEDSADKGPSMDLTARYGDLQKIRNDLKANFVRTGHFPHSLPTYRFADRIGLAIWQEIPAYWFSGDAFDLQRQRGQTTQMLEEMIFSNYNRPSVWFDGVANESGSQLQRVNFISELRDTAHAIDGTRLVAQSAAANPYEGESDQSHSAADVIGMTMYFGVFYGANPDSETQEEIEAIHAMHPGKPIIATEYGYWTGDESASDTRQTQVFSGTFNAFTRSATVKEDGSVNPGGLLSGAAWWTAYNWYTNITGMQTMGLYHMDRATPKQVADVLAERYARYTHVQEGHVPTPTGITSWFQNFESVGGYYGSDDDVRTETDADTPNGASGTSVKIANGSPAAGAYFGFVPQGSEFSRDLSVYNYLNLDVKDAAGNRPLTVTLVDTEGHTWTGQTEQRTVQDVWTRVSLPLIGSQSLPLSAERVNTQAIREIRIELSTADSLVVDSAFASTYSSDAMPLSYPTGKSGWFQSFEEDGVQVGQGTNAVATVDNTFGVNAGGHGSVKLVVTGSGADPGANGRSVIVKPQGGAASVDASAFNYLVFYVKDVQGANTVNVTFVDTYGTVSSGNWTSVASVKGQWSKLYVSLDKSAADIGSLKEIRLGEWNPGTYYFDDLYFAEYPSDQIPATYTEQIPEKPPVEGQIKVAMIGSSVTAGAGLAYPGVTAFPAQVQSILGDAYQVKNFGMGGRTMTKAGDSPYWNEPVFTASQQYLPDIVNIQLGTNDSKAWNWKDGDNNFLQDYVDMIHVYQNLPSHPKVFVNLPNTVYNDDPNGGYGITSSVLQNGVIPLIRQAAELTGAIVVDVNTATAGREELFPDKIHPNVEGAWLIAQEIAKAILGESGATGDSMVCKWKDCKSAAYSIVYADGIYDSVLRFEQLHKKYDLVGSLALVSGWVNDQYNDVGASTGTWAQWKEVLDRGYFDVAAHTVQHEDLTMKTAEEIHDEFETSVSDIRNNTGYVPQALVYPYNAFNDTVTAEAEKYFVVARNGGQSTSNSSNTTNYYGLYSKLTESTTTTAELNDWLDFGIAKGNWMILGGHGNDGEGWSSPPLSLFDQHYAHLDVRKNAVWVGTMAQVGKYLRERQNATIETLSATADTIRLKLNGTLDANTYDEPLTLRTKVPTSWTDVKVTIGGRTATAHPVHEYGGSFLYYEVVPGAHVIALTVKRNNNNSSGDNGSGNNGSDSDPATSDANLVGLSAEQLEAVIAKAEPDQDGYRTIRFAANPAAGAGHVDLHIPASYLISHDKLKLELSTPFGQLVLPGDMFAQQAGGAAETISLSFGAGDLAGASSETTALAGSRPVIALNASIDGVPVEWRSAQSPVTVWIPYQPTAEESAHPERLTVRHLTDAGTAEPVISGKYDAAAGSIVFTTHHFSRYAVVYVAKTFDDLGRFDWAKPAIEALASKGAVQGVSAEAFQPGREITRAEAITLVMRLLDLTAKRSESFSDVPTGAYYEQAVHAARTLGIISGRGDNRFDPQASVSRQELMAMIDQAMRAIGLPERELSTVRLEQFADAADVAAYAQAPAQRLLEAGIFQGYDNKLHPTSPVTRAEAAVALHRLYQLLP